MSGSRRWGRRNIFVGTESRFFSSTAFSLAIHPCKLCFSAISPALTISQSSSPAGLPSSNFSSSSSFSLGSLSVLPSPVGSCVPAAASPLNGAPKNNPFVDQNTFAWGHARVGHNIGELPAKALESAMEAMSEKPSSSSSRGNGSDGSASFSLTDFFDPITRRCTLCDLPITTTHQAHLGRHEHQARLGVVERSLALMNAFVLDFQKQENERPRGGNANNSSSLPQWRRRHMNGQVQSFGCTSSPSAAESMMFRMSRTPESLLGVDVSLLQQEASVLQNLNLVEILAKKWWTALDRSFDLNGVVGVTPPTTFCRLSHLSSPFSKERRWKLRYLLDWLKYHGILQSSLSIANVNISPEAFSRSQRFEVLEMVGDSVVKVELPDRLTRLFPHGVCSKLALFQRLIDSNSGLLDIYDWLTLDQIIGAKIAHSKAKADVVECIFGELQCFLWATEVSSDPINVYDAHPGKEFQYLRAIVQHTMHELMHAVFIWRLETTLESASRFIHAHGLELLNCQRKSFHNSKKRMKENDRDRGRYAVLPLVTRDTRPHELGHLSPAEMWYRSTHLAPTQAGSQQHGIRLLSPSPIAKPEVFIHRLEVVSFLPFVMESSFVKQKIASVKTLLKEKPSDYFPSKCALSYPQWRREEEKSATEQKMYDTIRDILPTNREMRQVVEDHLKRMVEPFQRHSCEMESLQKGIERKTHNEEKEKCTITGTLLLMPDITTVPMPRHGVEVKSVPHLKESTQLYSIQVKDLIASILRG